MKCEAFRFGEVWGWRLQWDSKTNIKKIVSLANQSTGVLFFLRISILTMLGRVTCTKHFCLLWLFCKKQTGCFCYCTFKTGSAPKLEKCNFVSQVYSKVKDMHPKYFLDSVQKEILIRLFSNYLAVCFCLWYLAKLHVDSNWILKFTSPLCAVFEDGYLYDMWFGVAACVELSKSLTSKIPFHLLTRLWNRA